jgi:hypothetical protein
MFRHNSQGNVQENPRFEEILGSATFLLLSIPEGVHIGVGQDRAQLGGTGEHVTVQQRSRVAQQSRVRERRRK